jgi:oligoribonuclease
MSERKENLIWIDLEMTGLNPDSDRIIEIATVVTDKQLNVLAEGPVLAVRQPDELLAGMDEWNTSHHTESGLLERVQKEGVSEKDAQEQTLAFLQEHTERGLSPMCGNSICQDRRFLWRYMPNLEAWFHYRNLDVSTLKELAQRWAPEVMAGFKKHNKHLALADIQESIEEMRYYRERIMCV